MSIYNKFETREHSGSNPNDDDDWETDGDYVNEVTEEEQRWGGRKDLYEGQVENKEYLTKINTLELSKDVKSSHEQLKNDEYKKNVSFYGGSTPSKMSENK
eukprot:TRINITY_DN6859_c0_g1_i1.p1 TRINITY_DN6859_c0_g1~~TRINITY_DN6859_c0_g1_i1.p1  ORF type:complete len:101 (-),score=34.50 TRINITY_DN6859_c0_g1_i1:57-359(-)